MRSCRGIRSPSFFRTFVLFPGIAVGILAAWNNMNHDEIEEKIRALIAAQFEVPVAEITRDAALFKDFHTDSLDILDLVMAVQREFGVKILDEDLETLGRLEDFVNYIEKHLPQ